MDALLTPTTIDYSDLHIFTKAQRIEPLRLNEIQRSFIDTIENSGQRRFLILKPRQVGISTAIQAFLFKTAVNETARISTIAHDEPTTQKLRDMAQTFHDGLPPHRRPVRAINNDERTVYAQTRSTVYIDTAGSPQTGRGGTYSHVHGSEVAFWRNATKIMAGLIQGVPTHGYIFLESTPNGAQGWFYQECMAAQDGKSDFNLLIYYWWRESGYQLALNEGEHLEYTADELSVIQSAAQDGVTLTPEQIKWRRAKQRELKDEFPQEYPEDPYSCFLSTTDSYFALHAHTFSAPHNAVYDPTHEYVAGLDFGQSNDYTVCSVLDKTALQQVALLRIRKQSWADMRTAVRVLCERWGARLLVTETNSMGGTNIEELNREFQTHDTPTSIVPFTTTAVSKRPLVQGLRWALDEGGLVLLDDAAQRHEFRVFTSRQLPSGAWQYSAPDGEHDDCVMATALAARAVFSGGGVSIL